MNGTLTALRDVEKRLSERKGEFALFALFLPAESANRWDLVISAPWARRDDRAVLELVSNEMAASLLDRDDAVVGRIVVVETWHPDVQEINARVDTEHDWFVIANEEHFGYVAERGFIITSKDYWRFIKDIFPPGTEFIFFRDPRKGDFGIRISRFYKDRDGRSRRSRIILSIDEVSLDDYLYIDAPRRTIAETRLAQYVKRQLEVLDEQPRTLSDVEWSVPPEVLAGEEILVS